MTEVEPRPLRTAYYVALATMSVLLVGAVVWYRQRILFLDPAFVTYEVLDLETLMISERRYGSFITQGFPWLAGQLGIPLRGVLMIYSAGFYLFYLSVMGVVGLLWKQYGLGVLLALYFTLLVSDVYFWTNNEIHQAVTWMVLFLGCYGYLAERKHRFSPFDHLVLVVLIALAASSHMLVAAPFAFLWAYLGLDALYTRGRAARPWRLLAYGALIGAAVYARYLTSLTTSYDRDKLGKVGGLSLAKFEAAFGNGMSKTIQQHLLHDYWLLFPIAAVGLMAIIMHRRWFLLPTVILAAVGYYGLVCLTFSGSYDRLMRFYAESEWMGFGLIVATPFVVHFLPLLRRRAGVVALLVFIFGVRLLAIGQSYAYFDQRLENLTTVVTDLRALPGSKFILKPTKDWDQYFGMSWCLPLETLILSSLEADAEPVTLKPFDPRRADVENRDYFIGNFRTQPISSQEDYYFRLDTSTTYRVLTDAERDAIAGKLKALPKR